MNVTRQLGLLGVPQVAKRVGCWLLLLSILLLIVAACGGEAATTVAGEAVPVVEGIGVGATPEQADPGAAEVLPGLGPVTLAEDEKLRVVATTSLVADVVRRVGGDTIELTTLMPLGVDPHGYAPTPEDLRMLNDAHLILINGLGLEEALMPILTELDTPVPVVSVNAGLAPLTYGEGTESETVTSEEAAGEQDHLVDPHTWLSVNNVLIWVDNVAAALAMLDTANVDSYFSNASAYHDELAALDGELRTQIDTLPAERRKLVTDHREFSYFAQDYGFEIVGAVIPASSTMTSPSAQELATLQEVIQAEGVSAIFVGENVDASVVDQLANDLGLEVVKLYTSSLSDADGPAPDYPSLMRYNVNAIVGALAE
jgi:manganese/iron transport system substrate-binding protein